MLYGKTSRDDRHSSFDSNCDQLRESRSRFWNRRLKNTTATKTTTTIEHKLKRKPSLITIVVVVVAVGVIDTQIVCKVNVACRCVRLCQFVDKSAGFEFCVFVE